MSWPHAHADIPTTPSDRVWTEAEAEEGLAGGDTTQTRRGSGAALGLPREGLARVQQAPQKSQGSSVHYRAREPWPSAERRRHPLPPRQNNQEGLRPRWLQDVALPGGQAPPGPSLGSPALSGSSFSNKEVTLCRLRLGLSWLMGVGWSRGGGSAGDDKSGKVVRSSRHCPERGAPLCGAVDSLPSPLLCHHRVWGPYCW